MQTISYLEAWSHWWPGEKLENFALWGLSLLWWSRLGKLLQFLGSVVVVLDLIGPERLRDMGSLTRRAEKGIAGEAATWWRLSLPIRWEDQKKARLFFVSVSFCAGWYFWQNIVKSLLHTNAPPVQVPLLAIFGLAVSFANIIFFCSIGYLLIFIIRIALWRLFTLLGLTYLINEAERGQRESIKEWWKRFTPLRLNIGSRGRVILTFSILFTPLFIAVWPHPLTPDSLAIAGVGSIIYGWSTVLLGSFVLAWSAVLTTITLLMAIFHTIRAAFIVLAYVFQRDHPRHPIRWVAFLTFMIGFHFDLLGS